MLRRGDLVQVDDDMVAVVAVVAGEQVATVGGYVRVPEGHVGLWLGDPRTFRASLWWDEARAALEVWVVPAAACRPAPTPVLRQEGPGGGWIWDQIKGLFGARSRPDGPAESPAGGGPGPP
jgi:hypothetical protein